MAKMRAHSLRREKLSSSTPTCNPSSQGLHIPLTDVLHAGPAGDVTHKASGGMRRLFRWSNKKKPGPLPADSEDAVTGRGTGREGGELREIPIQNNPGTTKGGPAEATGQGLASVGSEIDAAHRALGFMRPVPRIGHSAVDGIDKAGAVVTNIQNISDTYLQPLQTFNRIASEIEKIHPYAQIALRVLTAASRALINQVNLDNDVSGLFHTISRVYVFLMEEDTLRDMNIMAETLGKIAKVIKDAANFIEEYAETTSFWMRLGKNIISEKQTVVGGYITSLEALMQQYRDRVVRDIQISTRRVYQHLSLDGMAYAGGVGLNKAKKCLDGTRTEIISEIVNWVHDTDETAPRVLWLHGQAGRGKSAIAHSVALGLKLAGELGSCFCFSRDRQAERREEKIFTTVARDLADWDPAFRRALADVLAQDHSLKTTCDVTEQWEKLVLDPLSKVSSTMIGSVVVVIDALDESGLEESRRDILSVLASQSSNLPHNFRVFVTSRCLTDIKCVLSDTAPHVKTISLDDVSTEFTERDIRQYVSKQLGHLRGIGDTEAQEISRKADHLFEWARLACDYIMQNKAGATVKERYDEVVNLRSEEGTTLLDATYSAVLQSAISQSVTAFKRYRSVMRQVIMTLEPLSMADLDIMRQHFPNEQDHYPVDVILVGGLSPVLGGVVDRSSPVRPLHASFYDFLTDHSRSGVYFIDTSCSHDLAVTTLRILRSKLQFNICGLETSYCSNADVADLPERISRNILPYLSYSCRFWARHLQMTTFDIVLVELVKALVGGEKFLFWLEAMSLLGEVESAATALISTATWLPHQNDFKDTLACVEDGIKFIRSFSGAVSHSAPHLYVSAPAFIPVKTILSRILVPKFCSLPGLTGGLEDWPVTQLDLHGHTDQVESVAFCPDGRRIVSGSLDNTVKVWDAERGVQIGSLSVGHIDGVCSVAFSPDGKRIVTGSWDNIVRVWNAEGDIQLESYFEGHGGGVCAVAFSSDGKKIVSGSGDKTVRVWDAERGVEIGSPLQGHTDGVSSVAFSHDSRRIVSGSWDKTVRVWEAEGGVQDGNTLEGHTSGVSSVVFSSDGERIISGSDDKTVKVWVTKGGVWVSNTLQGHTDGVSSVALSPDGKRIVTGSWDKTVRVWNVEDGQLESCFEGHMEGVSSVSFSPDGKRIVSGSEDKTLKVWVTKGVQVGSHLEGHTDGVSSVAFSPDGKRIVSGSEDKTVRIWVTEGGCQVGNHLEGHAARVSSVAFSPDGERIVSGSVDRTVRVWDVETGVPIGSHLDGHRAAVCSVKFSPDGKRVVSGSLDNTVRAWDAEGGAPVNTHLEGDIDEISSAALTTDGGRIMTGSEDRAIRVWDIESVLQLGSHLEEHTFGVCSVAYSPDGRKIVSGSEDKTVRVWDAEGVVEIGSPLQGHTNGVCSVAFSPDGKRIVSGSEDTTVRIWDAEGGVHIGGVLQGHTEGICSVAFSPDGKRIVSGSDDTTVRIWDAEWGVQIGGDLQGHTEGTCSVAFSPDGKRIVSGSKDTTVRIWDAEMGAQIGGALVGHTEGICSVAFSPDGKKVVSASKDGTMRIWDAESGYQISKYLGGHMYQVSSVAFSADGRKIVTGSEDNTVSVWDVDGVQIGSHFEGHTARVCSVAFSPDGKRIASGSEDNTVRVWDVERGGYVVSLLEGHTAPVCSVAFSFNSKMIVSGSWDRTVWVWDAERGIQAGSHLEGHSAAVSSVAFSPDGKRIVSSSVDKTVRVWDADLHECIISTHSELNLPASHLSDVLGPCHAAVNSYHICFSSVSSHALCESEQLLGDPLIRDRQLWAQLVKLHDDGWIRGPNGRLLLWIPAIFRQPFYSMWTTVVIPRGCCIELDLSHMAHGHKWHKCYRSVA